MQRGVKTITELSSQTLQQGDKGQTSSNMGVLHSRYMSAGSIGSSDVASMHMGAYVLTLIAVPCPCHIVKRVLLQTRFAPCNVQCL